MLPILHSYTINTLHDDDDDDDGDDDGDDGIDDADDDTENDKEIQNILHSHYWVS